jgi:hypothetical protein
MSICPLNRINGNRKEALRSLFGLLAEGVYLRMQKNKPDKQEHPEDPYTGEEKTPAEDADKIIEVVPVDSGDHEGEEYLLEEEISMDAIAADEDAGAVAKRSARYTEDDEIEDLFEERQELASGGRQSLKDELEAHQSKSPTLSGGDLDADWKSADAAGEETVGGTAPTPDQDIVDELGEAVGLTYEDDEPLQGAEKLEKRDRERWELDPESAREDAQPPEEHPEE